MHVVIGLGEDGRSKVVETRETMKNDSGEGDSTDVLFSVDHLPTSYVGPPRGEFWKDLDARGIPVNPGGFTWIISSLPPTRPALFHCTDTLDLQVVAAGEVTMVLEDGEVLLRPGDTIFNPGYVHAWRAGPDGCITANFTVGLASEHG